MNLDNLHKSSFTQTIGKQTPNNLLHLTAMKFLLSLLFIVAVAAGEQWRSAEEGS
jgi:hypothetical protein